MDGDRDRPGRPAPSRVALIAHPSPDMYGADRILLETVSGLVAAGWRVVVTIPSRGPLTARLEERGAEVMECPTVVLRKSYLRGLGLLKLVLAAVAATGPSLALLRRVRPDVVWVNTITVPLWLLLGRAMRRPVVVHAHEAEDTVAAVLRRALALPLSLAQVVVVNSEATGRTLRADGFGLSAKTRRIYNGVDGPPAAPHEIAPRPAARLRLLFVGRLSERKGPDLLVGMLDTLVRRGHDAQLELVGSVFPGYEWYEQRLHDEVRERDLDQRVAFTGFLPSVWEAYDRSDVAFVPSRVEPLGNTAVEAMLAGVPVVTARVQGLVEVADGGRCARLVPPDDPTALADAVEQMIADWPGTRAMAQSARESALERFTVDGYRTEVVAVAEELVAGHRGAS